MKIPDTAIFSKKCAKWTLNNPEAWAIPSTGKLQDYDAIAQISLATLMGVQFEGAVMQQGAEKNVFAVYFDTIYGKHWAYYRFTKDGRME